VSLIFKRSQILAGIDFRIIAIFALLPDFFDKIFGHILFPEALNNGRLFGHTLLFLLVFVLIFVFVNKIAGLIYTIPIMTHHVFDMLWTDPQTWYWPYFGWRFESLDINVWEHWFEALVYDPYVQITEVFGIVVIIIIIIYFKLNRSQNFSRLLRTGKIKQIK
jgi:hypothetical protein